mmetsp:Transcript_41791/g.108175  ORF Transcript_41791/g.108175 Transcript_41791/m.108175 type:complete len:274 (-) Transcript_41791:50-871(-)
MALTRVDLTSEVHLTCFTHALSTENEEVMGLLLGNIYESPGGESVSRIWMAMPQVRTDRRRDRVECSSQQLAKAAALAERFSKATGVETRIIGWYHSHPHITVLPSHVDLSTQAMYQSLEARFIGLIFSVFNTNATTKAQTAQVIAFQSTGPVDMQVRREVPMQVVPSKNSMEASLVDYVALQRILQREENKAYKNILEEMETLSAGASSPDPILCLHSATTYHLAMSCLMQHGVGPALQAMKAMQVQNKLNLEELQAEGKALEKELQSLSRA